MSDLQEISTNAEAFSILNRISDELNTGLTQRELLESLRLLENGADPTALALLIKQIKEEVKTMGSEADTHNPG